MIANRTPGELLWETATVLVIAPHADDETFGCGGVLAKAKAHGARTFVLYISVGDVSHVGARDVTDTTRAAELRAAATQLGLDGHAVAFSDSDVHMRLDVMPQRELVTRLESAGELSLESIRPDVLLLPAPSYNQDHRAVHAAGLAATRQHSRTEKHFTPIVMCYEQPQLSWGAPSAFRPNVFVDISAHLESKLRAHACHASQQRDDPHVASLANIERLARLRGAEIGVPAAEAYECLRFVL